MAVTEVMGKRGELTITEVEVAGEFEELTEV